MEMDIKKHIDSSTAKILEAQANAPRIPRTPKNTGQGTAYGFSMDEISAPGLDVFVKHIQESVQAGKSPLPNVETVVKNEEIRKQERQRLQEIANERERIKQKAGEPLMTFNNNPPAINNNTPANYTPGRVAFAPFTNVTTRPATSPVNTLTPKAPEVDPSSPDKNVEENIEEEKKEKEEIVKMDEFSGLEAAKKFAENVLDEVNGRYKVVA